MNLKNVAIGASIAGGVCAGGYVLHKSASSRGNSEEEKEVEAPQREVPSSPPKAPEGSMGANTSVNYQEGTVGKKFANHFLNTKGEEKKWKTRYEEFKKADAKGKLFNIAKGKPNADQLKSVCEQIHTMKMTDYNTQDATKEVDEKSRKNLWEEA